MSKFAFAALEQLEGYNVLPRGEMMIKVSEIRDLCVIDQRAFTQFLYFVHLQLNNDQSGRQKRR